MGTKNLKEAPYSDYIRHLLNPKTIMQKLLLVLAICFSTVAASAQLADGTQAPDFTLTDINGNSYTLSAILAQGKTVFIDVSAAWCGPCWAYHNTGALDEVYTDDGPNGTCSNNVVVLFIEGETGNTAAQLTGTSGSGVLFSQGDWVTGTPYPIIDLPSGTSFLTDYAINYFPTIYKICPDGILTEVGQQNPTGLKNSIEGCQLVNDTRAESIGGLDCSATYTPQVKLSNITNGTLTSCTINYSIDGGAEMMYNWTGSIAQGNNATVDLPSVTLAGGAHTFEAKAVDPNGSTDGNQANNCTSATFNVVTAAGLPAPNSQNFSATTFPYANWTIVNDNADVTWARATQNGGCAKYDAYNNSNGGTTDDMITAPYDLTSVSNASMTFKVAYATYSSQLYDGLEVLASNDCGATWTSLWYKEGTDLQTTQDSVTSAFAPTTSQWRVVCIDLNQYIGSDKLFLNFRAYNGYGNNIYVDEVTVNNFTCALSVDENSIANDVKLFPNPSNGNAILNFNLAKSDRVGVQVVNMIGETVYTENFGLLQPGYNNHNLNLTHLSNGIYMVNLNVGGTVSTFRWMLNK